MSGTSRLFDALQKLATANFQDCLVMSCCGARNFLLALAHKISTAATPYASLHLPPAALGNVPTSHTTPEDRQARLSGVGVGIIAAGDITLRDVFAVISTLLFYHIIFDLSISFFVFLQIKLTRRPSMVSLLRFFILFCSVSSL